MQRSTTTLGIGLSIIALVATLSGCSTTPGKVSESELRQVRSNAAELAPGTTHEAAVRRLDRANLVRLGSTRLDESTVEEWKAEAFHETGSGRDLFVTFLYFLDDQLVDQSDRRLDFRTDETLVRRWRGEVAR